MGCIASKLEETGVLAICRERKRQLKLAVEKRDALSDAHCKYCQALFAVSAAIKLFVARRSSPASPYLITFPPADSPSPTPNTDQTVINNPMFLEQRPTETTHETITCESCDFSTTSDSCEEEEEIKEELLVREEQICMYYNYMQMQMPPPIPSPQRDFGWDFFNPFDGVRPEVARGYRRISDDELRAVREEEGIPDLEEEGVTEEEQKKGVMAEEIAHKEPEKSTDSSAVKVVDGAHVKQGKPKGLIVIDNQEKGRELLEALKDIADHFVRAYDSGKEVSRMLEIKKFHLLSNVEAIKENSTKLMEIAITWHRSPSSKSSSCKSLVVSRSKNSLTWKEFNNDLFEECGVMDSGSHTSTLDRLYAWEKKLYEQVKAGDDTRKIYKRKCLRLRNQDIRGDGDFFADKTRAAVKDLYAQILVAIRSAESISEKIDKIREEELQPQIVELLKGLRNTWKIMMECHETQNKIISEVQTLACPTYGKFCNDSHRLATVQLEAELLNWRACFTEYVAAQKGYVAALHTWLTKFLVPEVEFCSRSRTNSPAPYQPDGPPLLVICHDWLATMEKLPDKSVSIALKNFSKGMKVLWHQQGEEQHQKRKVDGITKELDRRTLAFQKTKTMFLESKITEMKSSEVEPAPMDCQNEYLTEEKDQLDMFKTKLEAKKEKHQKCMQETERMNLNGIQIGFSAVFGSLVEFSKTSLKMYDDLLTYSENARRAGNQSYIEGSQVEENSSN